MKKRVGAMRIFVSILVVALVYSLRYVPGAVLNSLPQVEYTYIEERAHSESVSAAGEVTALSSREIYVGAPVIISELYVKVGDYVKEGDALFKIDKELTESVLSAGMLSGVEIGDIEGIEDILKELEKLDISYEKLLELLDIYNLSIKEYDKYTEKIKYDLEIVPETVVSSFSGVVSEINISEGTMKISATPLMKITDTENLNAIVSVNEIYAEDIEEGQRCIVSGSAFSNRKISGRVKKIYPTARKRLNGTTQETVIDVEIEFDEGTDLKKIKPGYSVSAKIYTAENEKVSVIPYECIMQDKDNQEYVYVLRNSTAVRKDIVSGKEFSDGAEVKSGLGAGDRVVVATEELQGDMVIVAVKKQNEE